MNKLEVIKKMNNEIASVTNSIVRRYSAQYGYTVEELREDAEQKNYKNILLKDVEIR